MTPFRKTLSDHRALLHANLRSQMDGFFRTLVMSLSMAAQNFLFFMIWGIFFTAIPSVQGWSMETLSRAYGLIAISIGLALFLCDGIRTLPERVYDNSFDLFLTKPFSPLPLLLFSRSCPSSLGDTFSGILICGLFGGLSFAQFPLLLLLGVVSSFLFVCSGILIFSASFWLKNGGRFLDQMFDSMIIFCAVPQINPTFVVRLVMYSILPAAFITMMPVRMLQEFSWSGFGVYLVIACIYALIAACVFHRGVRRYKS